MTRKAIFVSEETHAKFSKLIAQEIVKNKGKRITFDQMLNRLMNK